jgi:tRNA (guanine37-N1)-methyltransferase
LIKPWPIHILTLFPELFPGPLNASITGRALEKNIWKLETTQVRDFALDKHHSVDDEPFGGGAGMLMRADILGRAIDQSLANAGQNIQRILLSPKGVQFTQRHAKMWSNNPDGIMLVCGRFEGIDQRVVDYYNFEEISIGDFVMTGGEIAAHAIMDACVRLLPKVVGKEESLQDETFSSDLLEYPHYTRPQTWNGFEVPEILTSGHHANIQRWRTQQAEQLTKERRPDLWTNYVNGGKV